MDKKQLNEKLKSFVGNVVDRCTADRITARSIAYEAYGEFDCPDELSRDQRVEFAVENVATN